MRERRRIPESLRWRSTMWKLFALTVSGFRVVRLSLPVVTRSTLVALGSETTGRLAKLRST